MDLMSDSNKCVYVCIYLVTITVGFWLLIFHTQRRLLGMVRFVRTANLLLSALINNFVKPINWLFDPFKI